MALTMLGLARQAYHRARRFAAEAEPVVESEPNVPDLDARQFGWFQAETGHLMDGFKITSGDVVVDVGCGEGGTCLFSGNTGAEVIAVDIDPQKIELVNHRMLDCPARAYRGIVSDCNPLPLPDETATKVIAQEVTEHVDDPAAFLSELVRIGAPGAQYMISVPDPVGERLQKNIAPSSYWQKPNHLHIFEREEFGRLVTEAGLTIEVRRPYSFYWTMWWVFRWASDGGVGDVPFGAADTQVLKHWNRTWHALIMSPDGARIKKALDDFMPKSQVILARKT